MPAVLSFTAHADPLTDPKRILMRPRKVMNLDQDVHTVIVKALVMRYSPLNGPKIAMATARKHVPKQAVLQWGHVQIAEGGDRMCCRAIITPESLGRDCTYVRVCHFATISLLSESDAAAHQQYEATVDWNANSRNKQPDMMLQTFFGELQRVVKINLPATPQLKLREQQTLFYVIVKQCNAVQSREGFWEYRELGGLEAVDLGLVQSVVGQIFDQGKWVIIDRSRDRAHADIDDSEPQ